jgi:type II secretory pathway pseudopilin PulG
VFRDALARAGSNVWSVGVTAARGGLPPTIAYGRWTASGLSVESRDGSGALTTEGIVEGLAILSSVAIPSLLEARTDANEKAAVATLRSISSAQAMASTSAVLDLDRDGGGEYLFLDELCGVKNLRGTDYKCEPALLSSKWDQAGGGVITRSGYAYRIDLPSRDGRMISTSTAPNGRDVSAEDAEIEYVVYAWPLAAGNTANHVFVLDQEGDLWVSDNSGRRQGYSGLANPPPHDAWDSAWGIAASEKTRFTDVNGSTWSRIPYE